ncbi:MAG: FAD-binding oxidoreductase [Leptospiraceae bacterium]|nr:FAD-binding oxidoreductase [Leptospiraceae bacterium]
MHAAAFTEEKLKNALERIAAITGKERAIWPNDEKFYNYLSDATFLQGSADLVLRPQNTEELQEIVMETAAWRRALPESCDHLVLVLRGGGSGLSGACVPDGGIVIDLTLLDRILDIDEKNMIVQAQCGTILANINAQLATTPFFYPVDPSSEAMCTVGGSIATNAAGPSSLKYGTTRQNLAAMTFMTAEGKIVSAGSMAHKGSLGFSLLDLLCGSEGRLGIITTATLRLRPRPESVALILAACPSEADAAELLIKLRQKGMIPRAAELLDAFTVALADFPLRCPPQGALLMLEWDGTEQETETALENCLALVGGEAIAARGEKSRQELWNRRKAISLELKRRYPFRLGEDIAVPLPWLAHTIHFARHRAQAQQIPTAIWGHAGDGNLHVNYLAQDEKLLPTIMHLMAELAHEATRCGGVMSGEHGLGRLKRRVARDVLPPEYWDMERRVKEAFDRDRLFNPALDKA